MILENSNTTQSCFQLLQKVMDEGFRINVLYYTPPYQDLSKIDLEMRKRMWSEFIHHQEDLLPEKKHPERRFFVIQSNLGFSHIIIYLNYERQPDFFAIGPFRCENFSISMFSQLLKDNNLPITSNNIIQKYYEQLPYVALLPIVNICKEIVTAFFPEFQEITPIYADFAEQIHKIQVNNQLLEDLSVDYAENYQKHLFRLCEFVSKGDTRHAMESLKQFQELSNFFHSSNINDWKKNLYLLNNYCQATLLGTIVHPVYTLKLYSSFRHKIETAATRDQLLMLPNTICHKYCLLVKNYAFPEYSQTVRDVINFIHLHLDEDLTLSVIAHHFRKNATSLSSSFSKEVGMNITNYIHKIRIHEAIRYFNSTKMSISEVALMVGFQDFAYFSRIFHKHVGCSPRDYCKQIHR